MTQVTYPVDRLLANSRIFFAISKKLKGPDGETLKDAFYSLLEHSFEELEEPEFEAQEVCFRSENGGDKVDITLDTGFMLVLEAVGEEIFSTFSNDGEFAASTAIYNRLIEAINDSHPELKNNIVLCSPPTPGNSYLRSPNGDYFEGEFHLLSDPEKKYSFNVEVIDLNSDTLKATIKPQF